MYVPQSSIEHSVELKIISLYTKLQSDLFYGPKNANSET